MTARDDPRRHAALRQELAELLRTKLSVLKAAGYPGTVSIVPWGRVGEFPPELIGPRLAWPLRGVRHREWPPRAQEAYLGVDGEVYRAGDYKESAWTVAELGSLDTEPLEHALADLRWLLRVSAPSEAFPERIAFLGVVFTLVPKVVPVETTPEQQRALDTELQREGPPDQEITQQGASRPHSDKHAAPPGRTQQTRYLFLSWLHLITTTGYWTHEDGGHPEQFLDPFTPYVPGGLVRPEEVVAAAEELVADGFAEWVDGYLCGGPPWRLILTDAGVPHAEHAQRAQLADPQRARALRMALLGWVANNAKQPHTVSLDLFVNSASSLIDGVASTVTEVHRAARWLARRGYIHQPPDGIAAVTDAAHPIAVGLTREGVVCIDEYGGDPWAMRAAQRRGDDRRTFTFHGPTGNLAIDAHDFTQHADMRSVQVDVAALRHFAEAVLHDLPNLGLDPDVQQVAERKAAEILTLADQPQPDHPKLRAIGRTLWTIIQEATSNVIADVILRMWRP